MLDTQRTIVEQQRADLSRGHDVIQGALEKAGFKVTVVDPGPTTSNFATEYAKNPKGINEPVIWGIETPSGTGLSLTLNVTP